MWFKWCWWSFCELDYTILIKIVLNYHINTFFYLIRLSYLVYIIMFDRISLLNLFKQYFDKFLLSSYSWPRASSRIFSLCSSVHIDDIPSMGEKKWHVVLILSKWIRMNSYSKNMKRQMFHHLDRSNAF